MKLCTWHNKNLTKTILWQLYKTKQKTSLKDYVNGSTTNSPFVLHTSKNQSKRRRLYYLRLRTFTDEPVILSCIILHSFKYLQHTFK